MRTSKKMPFLAYALSLFLVLSCQEKEKKQDESPDDAPEMEEVEAPENIISLKQAKSIYDNYSKNRIPQIVEYETNERAPEEEFQAARFADFDLKTIKQYIDYVEQEAQKAGVKEVKHLRLYFANYPNEERFPDRKRVVHPRQNSIFIVPTMEMDGGDYGFYIGDDGKAKRIADWSKEMGENSQMEQKSKAGFTPNFSLKPALQGNGSLTLNRGGSGPPPHTDF